MFVAGWKSAPPFATLSGMKLPLFPLLAAASLLHAAEPMPWKVGVASVVITPETDMPMAGYAARTKPSEGKVQDLFAKALAIEDAAGTRLVIVTLDLIGVPRDLRLAIEARAQADHRLPREALLLNASHTHCGPEFRIGRDRPDVQANAATLGEDYGRELQTRIAYVIATALQQAAPAGLTWNRARAGFAMNRRLPTDTGYANSPYPDGPVDHDVPVLAARDADGKLRALLFGYACHATTLGFQHFCGDYPGYAQEYLETDHPGATALFLNGCSGDQNPYPRRDLEYAKRHGRALAMAVETALTVVPPRPVRGSLRAAYAEIALAYSPPPTRAEFEQRLAGKDKYLASHARKMLDRLDREGALPTEYPHFPVQMVRFGDDLLLTALGGETTVDYSLRLKRELAGLAAVWVAGYSNDVMAYIPSRRVREEGGYEGGDSMRYYSTHPGPWAPELEERIVAKVHELHRHLSAAPIAK
jgi:hypothetical protein